MDNGSEPEVHEDVTLGRLDLALLRTSPHFTLADLAREAGVTEVFARGFWRSMGFPDVKPDDIAFTSDDVTALRTVDGFLEAGLLDERTASSLLRALGHTNDRLALWLTEALVDDAVRRFELDDTSARMVVLDRLPGATRGFEELIGYGWRRQMSALAHRIHDDVALRHLEEDVLDQLPLIRAIGFADMVSYTELTARLGPQALASLVQSFEDTARDVVTAAGARVVKMIGDAVLYVADELTTAAAVSLDLIDAIQALPGELTLRSSVVWGRVLSRSGDVFGPTVNLAARLAEVAQPGTVLLDRASAAALAGADVTGVALVPQYPTEVDGLGLVTPVELRRAPLQAPEAGSPTGPDTRPETATRQSPDETRPSP